MRRALIGVGVVATLVVGGASSADAAVKNTSCVTNAEFGKVKVGMSKAQVAKVIGGNGTRASYETNAQGYGEEVRTYKACNLPTATVQVVFGSKQDLPAPSVGWAAAKVWVEGWK
ncbi:hypothetical protein [Kineosporia sp. NBRC 101731]|uniref:hypothetical protein n=1 Tax=Kineosporia sp. NBRC 101731 TaxID=3032199 RepID=UPI0024A4593C|nr:hypothetical protein [Kineosporia sp. NBRC 101731]GLY31573.1 hypothetical protein Kisp02_49380 [Kineosporia sp. NBRC 101731]